MNKSVYSERLTVIPAKRPARERECNPKEAAFARAFFEVGIGSEAIRRAGYATQHAEVKASRLLRRPCVVRVIRELQQQAASDVLINIDRVMRGYAEIAFANIDDFIDRKGRVDLSKVSRAQLAAVSSIETETYVEGKGEDAETVKRVKLKFHNKQEALDSLARIFGAFERDNAQKSQGLQAFLEFLMQKGQSLGVTSHNADHRAGVRALPARTD
jgi:phage terminase small subunit